MLTESRERQVSVVPKAYEGIYNGIRDRRDTVTWRTMVVEMRRYLGAEKPETQKPIASYDAAEELVTLFTQGTYLEALKPEILYSLGYPIQNEEKPLNFLLVNARSGPEEILWDLADCLHDTGKSVAVMNPNGHYNDIQQREVGLPVLLHEVDTAVFITSTQKLYGGSVSTLVETMELLRNPDFSSRINRVVISLPLFGGSRGHKPGQASEIGYEVLQMESIPRRLALLSEDIQYFLDTLKQNNPEIRVPIIEFTSIDIHNRQRPGDFFRTREKSYDFTSISPSKCFASVISEEIHDLVVKGAIIRGLPFRMIAVDIGAGKRTEELAIELLLAGANGNDSTDVFYMNKRRGSSGEVESVELQKIVRYKILDDGQITNREIELSDIDLAAEHLRITSDDILDTGNSAKQDDRRLDIFMPNPALKLSVFTHGIMSREQRSALDNTGSDIVFIGNTVTNPDLVKDHRVRKVDLAPSLANFLLEKT